MLAASATSLVADASSAGGAELAIDAGGTTGRGTAPGSCEVLSKYHPFGDYSWRSENSPKNSPIRPTQLNP